MEQIGNQKKRLNYSDYFEDDWRLDKQSDADQEDEMLTYETAEKEQEEVKQPPRLTVKITHENDVKLQGYLSK